MCLLALSASWKSVGDVLGAIEKRGLRSGSSTSRLGVRGQPRNKTRRFRAVTHKPRDLIAIATGQDANAETAPAPKRAPLTPRFNCLDPSNPAAR